MNKLLIMSLLVPTILIGCKDKYREGYQIGYSDGVRSMESKLEESEKKLQEEKSKSQYSFGSVSTQVCGGTGVNLNGKHYSGGKTGCVRVYSDGRVEKY
jgi:hypothetical protein